MVLSASHRRERAGVGAALASSILGGIAVALTRFVAADIDPAALGALRFGIGCVLLWPVALRSGQRWPARADWPATVVLGVLVFALFPLMFNVALRHTTAAHGALALATMPLMTMATGALLGVERLTRRKTTGVLVALLGVAAALLSGLTHAPPQAWRGDLMMVGATALMALYNVLSPRWMHRSGTLTFTVAAMAAGALVLVTSAAVQGHFGVLAAFGTAQWLAVAFLGLFGGAIGFLLWAWALANASPTRVAIAVSVNPIAAGLTAALLLHEWPGWSPVVGLVAVVCGVSLASRPDAGSAPPEPAAPPDRPAPPKPAARSDRPAPQRIQKR